MPKDIIDILFFDMLTDVHTNYYVTRLRVG